MPLLADLQSGVRLAVTGGRRDAVPTDLVGGADPGRRLAIHGRHYTASLTQSIAGKFPATAWLVGGAALRDAARAYVGVHPPRRPCIAEYGEDFPAFLGRHGNMPSLPYVAAFARLEWAVGLASIAVEHPPVGWPELAALGPAALPEVVVALQPGLFYQRAGWEIDRLMTAYLADAAPERFVLQEADTCIQVRGARGRLALERIDAATYAFRSALQRGANIGEAAGAALDADASVDAGALLVRLTADGLITGVRAADGTSV